MLTSIEKIQVLLKRQHKTVKDLAEATGQTKQNLWNKFQRGDLRESEIRACAEALGYDLEITFISPDGDRV